MKLGIFADPHWCGQDVLCRTRRPRLSLAKMQAASEAFAKAGVDLILCMGDLVDPEETHEAEIFHLKTAFTTDGITVEKICEANYISTASLFRLFKENTGESPKEYIGKIKIQMASTILRITDIEIAEIGKQLGYYDYSHFYKSFTAAKGLSPAMYRKKYR